MVSLYLLKDEEDGALLRIEPVQVAGPAFTAARRHQRPLPVSRPHPRVGSSESVDNPTGIVKKGPRPNRFWSDRVMWG